MALIRVAQYNSTPTVVEDYQAQNAHLQAFTNQLMTQQFILDSGTAQPVIKQGCYVSHGGSLYVADADTAITGSPSDGSAYIRVSGTTSLTVEFINDISGYTWNPVYTALTNGSYTLLPYLIVKASTVWIRYNFNPNNQQFGSLASLAVTGNTIVGGTLGVTGAINGASLNTGSGAMTFNQGVKTTDSPTFASVITGNGPRKFTFESINNPSGSVTLGSMEVGEFKIVNIRANSSSFTIYTPGTSSYRYYPIVLRTNATSNMILIGGAGEIDMLLPGGQALVTESLADRSIAILIYRVS